jgi:hypothetical protein
MVAAQWLVLRTASLGGAVRLIVQLAPLGGFTSIAYFLFAGQQLSVVGALALMAAVEDRCRDRLRDVARSRSEEAVSAPMQKFALLLRLRGVSSARHRWRPR